MFYGFKKQLSIEVSCSLSTTFAFLYLILAYIFCLKSNLSSTFLQRPPETNFAHVLIVFFLFTQDCQFKSEKAVKDILKMYFYAQLETLNCSRKLQFLKMQFFEFIASRQNLIPIKIYDFTQGQKIELLKKPNFIKSHKYLKL